MLSLETQVYKTQEDLWPRAPHIMSYPSLGIDIETTGLDPYRANIVSVQIANGVDNKVDILDVRQDNFQEFFNVLATYKGLMYFQNGKFDLKFFAANYGFLYPEDLYDTLIAERLIDGGRHLKGFGLEKLAKKYLDLELSKDIRKEFTLPLFSGLDLTDAQIRYGALDAWVLPRIAEAQKRFLDEAVPQRILDLEFGIVPVVAKAELKGFILDREAWTKIYEEEEIRCQELAIKLRELAGHNFNPNSTQQVKRIMGDLGIELPVLKGKETTSGELIALIGHPFTDTLVEYRQAAKRVSTYGEEFLQNINPVSGRVHPTFDQLGTDTGRFSSKEPNFQNIPKRKGGEKFRKCFIAPEGKMIISADFTGQEIMVMAEASRDPALIQIYLDGRDRHTFTASVLYGVDYDEVTGDQRRTAKDFNFGVSYGGTAFTIARKVRLPEREVEGHLKQYWSVYSELKKWTRRTGLQAWSRGYSETFWGRRRYYDTDNLRKDAVMRQGTNHRIQGTAADMTKLAILEIDQFLRGHNSSAFMNNFVHDEVELETPELWAEDVAEEVEGIMEAAGGEFVTVLPQKAGVSIGNCWL